MPKKESICAVVPVAGRPLLVKEALTSILEGTTLPDELIAVIDSQNEEMRADKEAVSDIFQKFSHLQTNCRILYSDGRGPAAARNKGIFATSCDWLAFLDSDDVWMPQKLENQLGYLAKRPHLKGCQTLEIWEKNEKVISQPAHLKPLGGFFLNQAFRYCLISPSSVVLHKSCFHELGPLDENFEVCEDFEFWLRYLSKYAMGLLDERLTRKRSGDWTQQSKKYHSLDSLRIKAILKTVKTQPLPEENIIFAYNACIEKYHILENGAKKRNQSSFPLIEEIISVFQSVCENRKFSADFLLSE